MSDIQNAARLICDGEVVAFPTETVYGLGADATNAEAVNKIYKIKNRPLINPLIVHVADLKQAMEIAVFNEAALQLAQSLWPGPLTLILPLKQDYPLAKSVLAGLTAVAIRIPKHPVALRLLALTRCPIAAPSANVSGYISATTSEHVEQDFNNKGIFVLKVPNVNAFDKQDFTGLESTIIDLSVQEALSNKTIHILRSGSITVDMLQTILPYKYINAKNGNTAQKCFIVKSPGMLLQHYAPTIKLRKDALELADNEIGLNFGTQLLRNLAGLYTLNLSNTGDLQEAAQNLYMMLRKLDEYAKSNKNIKAIAVAPIPEYGIGIAINDRLERAASS